MVRWCWVTFQCRGVLLISIRVGQGPTALAVGAGGGCLDIFSLVCRWLVGCFGFNGPLRQYFSLYRAISQREGERGEKRIDESKNVQTTPTRTYYKSSRPLPYCNPNCRTPRHWKFTQHHRTTRPPPSRLSFLFSFSLSLGDGPI